MLILSSIQEALKSISSYIHKTPLIYSNSFGLINWTSDNLTTFLPLQVGDTIFLEQNNVGLLTNGSEGALNDFAQIELKGLAFGSTPQLLKDGVRCDDLDICNITAYTGGILYANVSSFSNYTAFFPDCGDVSSSITLISNLTSTTTCFTINSDNLVIDGAGFTLTGDGSGNGFNNSDGFDNITIRNFAGINNFSTGFHAVNMANSTFWNNTVVSASAASKKGIYWINGSHSNISNNNLRMLGAVNDVITLTENSSYNTIHDNDLNAIFTSKEDEKTGLKAYRYLKNSRKALLHSVAGWTKERKYTIFYLCCSWIAY